MQETLTTQRIKIHIQTYVSFNKILEGVCMNIAVYCRVSSEDQAERGTIESQVEFATKYCDLHQLNIIEWYKDDGITGTLPLEQRPEGLRLLQDAKNGKYDTLLVYKLDRLGRAARIVLNAVHELEQNGVKVKSMTEPFDTGDSAGRFLLTILAGVADLERSNILDRMWQGANRAARSGKWLGGIVPYGYEVNEGFLEVSTSIIPGFEMSEADVISLIYTLTTEQNMSTIKIADYLNALGVPPSYTAAGRSIKRGKRTENTAGIWRPGRIWNMLVNKTYMGIHEYGKRSKKNREIITREVPAIVTEEVWVKAQEVLKSNIIEATRSAKRQYLLRGLLKCSHCGLNYVGTGYPTGEGYYVCNGKNAYRGPLQGKCMSKNVPQAWIEDIIWNDCVNYINNPGEALSELDNSMGEVVTEQNYLTNEKELILSSIREKESEKQSILDLYRRKIISSDDVEKQLQKISEEKSMLQARLETILGRLEAAATYTDQLSNTEKQLSDLREKLNGKLTFDLKREIVKMLVNKITVETKNAEGNKPRLLMYIQYRFCRVVLCTDKDS